MAKLSKEEAEQLAALRAKEEAPDEPEQDDEPGGDDGHVIVLRGSRADAFLNQLLGPAPKRGNSASEPANTKRQKTAPKSAAEQAEDDDDQADAEGAQDAPPPRANRYFR